MRPRPLHRWPNFARTMRVALMARDPAIDSAEKRAPGPSSWEPSFTVRDLLPGPSRTLQACRNHASDPVATQAVWLYPACIRRVP
jgi:hypothetical protein